MNNAYPPGGALFNNTRKTSDKAPDVTGNLEISQELLDHLNDAASKGQPLKMDLSGWKKPSRNGGSFFSLRAKPPFQGGQQQEQRAPQRPPMRPAPPQRQAPPSRSTTSFDLDDEIPF